MAWIGFNFPLIILAPQATHLVSALPVTKHILMSARQEAGASVVFMCRSLLWQGDIEVQFQSNFFKMKCETVHREMLHTINQPPMYPYAKFSTSPLVNIDQMPFTCLASHWKTKASLVPLRRD